MSDIIAGRSPFHSTDYRPRSIGMRMQNGETLAMAKTADKPPTTTPVPPAPNGKVRTAFGTVTDPKPLPTPSPIPDIDFGEGDPKLDDIFDGQSSDLTPSPDMPDSPIAAPLTDAIVPEPVKTGEPPHWTAIEAQMKQYRDFVMGQINDYGLLDRDETQALIDWNVDSFLAHHKIVLTDYATFGEARSAIVPKFVDAFKNDLRAIASEKGHPLDTRNDLHAFIGYYTIEDALQKMTGTGIRAAIYGKLAAMEQVKHIEQVNAAASRQIAEQQAQATGDPFQPATDDGVYLKMAIAGPSGSGKSFTSLKIAREMFPDGKIAFLCTEHKAARRYAKHFQFNLMEISDYHPQRFIDAIHDAEKYGYDVLIIDSLSHEWSGTGGLLSLVDGKFGGWKEATPLHQKLIETIQEANIHIIVTMRSKMEYSQEKDERTGKTVVRKLGMAPVQREQTEYEFDIYAEIEMGSELTISKSRCFALKAGKTFVEGNGLAPVLKQWIAA